MRSWPSNRGAGYCILISFIYLVVYSFIVELVKGGSSRPS
jgi:hypothetical protein